MFAKREWTLAIIVSRKPTNSPNKALIFMSLIQRWAFEDLFSEMYLALNVFINSVARSKTEKQIILQKGKECLLFSFDITHTVQEENFLFPLHVWRESSVKTWCLSPLKWLHVPPTQWLLEIHQVKDFSLDRILSYIQHRNIVI